MLTAAILATECVRSLGLGAYLDHLEGNIDIGGWQWAHGVPIYAMQDGITRFANIYGPLAYLAPLPLLGPSVAASKVPAA